MPHAPTPSPTPSETLPLLPTAADIRRLVENKSAARMEELRRRQAVIEEEEKQRRAAFMERTLTPGFIGTVMTRVQHAAEIGEKRLLLGQFPCDWCTDGGRKINVMENDWPGTLQGFARMLYDFWVAELKPRGFGLSVEVVSFKEGGIPGDIGAFLSWKG
ncbi:hypothetical protein FBZ89_102450 [Nitrospirillum amazonense]|uniref:Uncharacterized protein n=1 Tax=Nitrospirillum amazonense TaxID=28077 RepID=A0A560FQ00_9PROT|nr:hypothetical protein [Nitrospirillum amazonense]TWB23693.1 hypothetical protein FBZ89_102450 [Nitrospirillum amazonense]